MQEKRKFVRLDVRVKVEYQIVPSTQDKIRSFTKNLSQGGICLFLDSDLEKDTLLDLKLSIPEQSQPILATGKVVWVDSFRVGDSEGDHLEAGIEFVDIFDEDRAKIAKYVFGVLQNK
jgi:uncharacterized protein (TIGR02266 family)